MRRNESLTFLSVVVPGERRQHPQTGISSRIFFAKRIINRVTPGKHKGQSSIVELLSPPPDTLPEPWHLICYSYVSISTHRMPPLQVLAGFKFALLPFQKMNYWLNSLKTGQRSILYTLAFSRPFLTYLLFTSPLVTLSNLLDTSSLQLLKISELRVTEVLHKQLRDLGVQWLYLTAKWHVVPVGFDFPSGSHSKLEAIGWIELNIKHMRLEWKKSWLLPEWRQSIKANNCA